jgi:ribosomal protein L32
MTPPTEREHRLALGLRRKSLEAKVVRACQNCGAPGVYSDAPSIETGWPGCYDPVRAQMEETRPVGSVCPNCGAGRPGDEGLGEISASIPKWVWATILSLKGALLWLRSKGVV